ncbi:MAG: hypothetical protein N3A54_01440 [Patescibacteria group bacterium]|nr:hypothetical protein [Patescibacteria group bacterium]
MNSFKDLKSKLQSIKESTSIFEEVGYFVNDENDINTYFNSALMLSMIIPLVEASANVINTIVSKISDVVDTLEGYKLFLDGKEYRIDWDGVEFTIKDKENTTIHSGEAEDVTSLKNQLKEFFINYSPEEKGAGDDEFSFDTDVEKESEELDIDAMIETETDDIKREKLANLKQYIIPDLINVFVKTKEARKELIQALLAHIKNETIPPSLKSGVKSTIIKLFFNIVDIISDDRKFSSTLSANAGTSTIFESVKKKKRRSVLDSISKKLEYLLRLGLVDKKLVVRAKKALTMDKVTAATLKIYRDIILDILSEILEYIEKDQLVYNKIRILLSKKGTLKESVMKPLFEHCGYKNAEDVVMETTPPNFPEKLKKEILKRYDDEKTAYAVMWKIHNKRKKGKETPR